jgi:peptidoglycan/LPS O-acetylase OafA/YrhL
MPLAVGGEEIPLAGFAQLTVFATVIGVVLGKVLSRRASRPRRTFTVSTLTLTAASLVPDVLVDATAGSKAVLMLTHLVAASIVIPVVARRLAR